MKADLPENHVEDISIAVVLENDTPEGGSWQVYLINEKDVTIENVMVSSKGYGQKDNKDVKTSVLRHFVGNVESQEYARIEAISPEVFGLTNEYWLSFYIDGTIYDKKYIFLPDSIVDEHMIRVPVLNKPGVVIGGQVRHGDKESRSKVGEKSGKEGTGSKGEGGRTNTIIAIDGYSSCGKSTLAKQLAAKLGFVYVDSGAMYRAVTLYVLRNKVNIDDPTQLDAALAGIHIDLHHEKGQTQVLLNGEDVSEEIREMHVSEFVSEVSAVAAVRKALVAQQQALGRRRNIVMDGRDIGTQVFPDADLKLFMTADPMVRARRRFLELQLKGLAPTFEEVMENLKHRDHIDTTREESPLVQAEDAMLLDNTHFDEQQQLQVVLDELVARGLYPN